MTMGTGFLRHLLAHEADAVEVRHDEIAGDDVRLELDDALQRLLAVARRADDLEERAARQQLRHDLPDVGGIVHDENAKHAGRQTSVRTLTV